MPDLPSTKRGRRQLKADDGSATPYDPITDPLKQQQRPKNMLNFPNRVAGSGFGKSNTICMVNFPNDVCPFRFGKLSRLIFGCTAARTVARAPKPLYSLGSASDQIPP